MFCRNTGRRPDADKRISRNFRTRGCRSLFSQKHRSEQFKENCYIIKVALIPLALLLIPAIAFLIYMILNPDALMFEETGK